MQHGIETCLGTNGDDCSRQGYYLFYVGNKIVYNAVDEIAYQISSSPFLDDKGNPIPVIAVSGNIFIASRQLPLPVSFSEEVLESQPRVIHLPVLSRTDEALQVGITARPAMGALHHLIDAPRALVVAMDEVQGNPPPAAYVGGMYADVQAPLKYCKSPAFSDARVWTSDGRVSFDLVTLQSHLHYANCSDVGVGGGGLFVAEICRYYLNHSSACSTYVNASCYCAQGVQTFTASSGREITCLGPLYMAYNQRISEITVKPSPSYLATAALLGHSGTVRWLLSVGANKHPLSLELAAAAGHSDIVTLLLESNVPWNERAIFAARMRGHTEIAVALDKLHVRALSGESTGFLPSTALADGSDRCFVRGPEIATAGADGAEGGGQVYDAQLRVLFVPKAYATQTPLFLTFEARRPGNWEANAGVRSLGATATIDVIPLRNFALANAEMRAVTSSEDLIFLNLPLDNIEGGGARARITSFPRYGELYNVIEPADFARVSNGSAQEVSLALASHATLGPKVSQTQDKVELLPAQILNFTGDRLHALPPGPWKGSLFHPPVAACTCRASGVTAAGGVKFAVKKECGATGAFEEGCGQRGTDVVVLRYPQRVFPEELVVTAWLPDSCRLRVLALHPPALSVSWHPVSRNTSADNHVTSPSASVTCAWEYRARPSLAGNRGGSATTQISAGIQSVLTGCAGAWEPLWEGTVLDIRDSASPGSLRLPLAPPHFETDTLLVQVCGLRGKGIGLTDGGNMLEGLRAVLLRGTVGGKPQGLVEHSAYRLAYRRFPGPAGQPRGGLDVFSFSAFDGGLIAPRAEALTLDLAPRIPRARDVHHMVSLKVGGGGGGDGGGGGGEAPQAVPLVPLGVEEGGRVVQVYIIITQLPSRGRISAPPGFTLAASASHTCAATTVVGWRVTPTPSDSGMPSSNAVTEVLYQTADDAGGEPVSRGVWDAFRYVVCSADAALSEQVLGYRFTSITYICPPAWFSDAATGTCQRCRPGFAQRAPASGQIATVGATGNGRCGSGSDGGALNLGGTSQSCVPCAPGSNRSAHSVVCLPCPRGYYAELPGADICSACPPGTFASRVGL